MAKSEAFVGSFPSIWIVDKEIDPYPVPTLKLLSA